MGRVNRTKRYEFTVNGNETIDGATFLSAPFDTARIHGEIVSVRVLHPTSNLRVLDTLAVRLYMQNTAHPSDELHQLYDSGTLTHGDPDVDLSASDDGPIYVDHLGDSRIPFVVDNTSTMLVDIDATVSGGSGDSTLGLEVDYVDFCA